MNRKEEKSWQRSRRDFLITAASIAGAGILPVLPFAGCAKKNSLEQDEEEEMPQDPDDDAIAMIGSQVWYVNNAHNSAYTSLPTDPYFRLFSGLPAIPRANSVPFSWGTENFYIGNVAGIKDTVYSEPGKLW